MGVNSTKDKYEQAIDAAHYPELIPQNLDPRIWEFFYIRNFWSDFVSSVDRNLQKFKQATYADKHRVLRWRVVDDDEPNAGAIVLKTAGGEEFDFIKLNFGLIRALHHLIHRIMGDPRNFTHIGDCLREKISDPMPLYHNVGRVGVALKPVLCPVRAIYAHGLLIFSLNFLMLHEFSHILRGHLEYFRNFLNIVSYEEVLAIDSEKFSGLPRQVLEIDADKNAILFLSTLLQASYEGSDNFVSENADQEKATNFLLGTQNNRLQTIHLASYLFFRLFGKKWSFAERFSTEYPAAIVRGFVASIDAFRYTGGQVTRDSSGNFESKFSDNLKLIEDSISNITGVSDNGPEIILSLTNGLDKYIAELKACWVSMLPELLAKSRGDVPPVIADGGLWG